jgi:hypothetical protein
LINYQNFAGEMIFVSQKPGTQPPAAGQAASPGIVSEIV